MVLVSAFRRTTRDVRFLGVLLAVSLLPRIPTLAQPLLEKHPFRQTWTAYTALLYRDGGIDLLHPELPVFGPPFFHPQEFPLFQGIAAIVMRIGVAPDEALRITALACFFATTVLVFGLVRHVAGALAACAAAAFFVASPFALVWSRASLIEYLATAGVVGYLWAGIRYRERRSWRAFAIALLAGCIGILVKPTTGVFCVLPLVLYRTAEERGGIRAWIRERLDLRLIALGLIPAVLALAWTVMADEYFRNKLAAGFLAPSNLRDYYIDITVGRGQLDLWGLIASRFAFWVVGVPFIPVLVLGLVIAWRSPARGFWIGLALAAALPVLVFYGGYRRHDYYQAAISPEVAAFLGLGAAWLVTRALAYRRGLANATMAIGIAALLYVYISTADYWQPIYRPVFDSEAVLPAARELAAFSRPGDLVVMVGRGFDPDVFYYARRTGLLITFENGSAALYRTLPAQAYRVFFSWDPARDPIDIMKWWAWSGSVGARTYEIGATPAALQSSAILSTDDVSAFDTAARGARSLAPEPVTVTCDGTGHQIPADPEGTWLLASGPADAIVYLDLLEGPLPIRRVFALTPLAIHGATTVTMSCSGTGSLTLERIIAAPPPR